MEKYILIILLSAAVLLSASCGNAGPALEVLQGNYAYGRGDFQEANVFYLKAAEKGRFTDVIAYNLGTVYHALGESEAALEEWRKAQQTASEDLLPEVLYNQGVLLYDLGEYQEAYLMFRRVLELDPLREDARINYEFTLRKMSARNTAPRTVRQIPDESSSAGDVDRVLQYVERKEQALWGTGTIETEYQQDW
ncbi:MAG: tetratricopeptide repeat protein [Spirochaetales bacterium]|nr:tetratricopeptide repeat protein [Spirochaetales bacterium]